jgi:hypothetical protein
MKIRSIKLLSILVLVFTTQGCSKLYEAVSCSNNTSPVFIEVSPETEFYHCGPHKRCQKVSLSGTDIWIKWEDQEKLILSMWGFYDKEAILRRSIDNLNLSIIDKGNRNVVFKEYSNLKWVNGEPVVNLNHKITPSEIYNLSFDLNIETTSGNQSIPFSGSLEKGSVRTCVPLV